MSVAPWRAIWEAGGRGQEEGRDEVRVTIRRPSREVGGREGQTVVDRKGQEVRARRGEAGATEVQ